MSKNTVAVLRAYDSLKEVDDSARLRALPRFGLRCSEVIAADAIQCRVNEGRKSNVGKVRIADIEVRCSEGPVWIILLFKQLFICVHFYQLCQAEELL